MRTSSRPSQSNRFLLEMNIISPRHLLQGYLGVRRVVLPSPPHPLVVLHLAEVRLSHGGSGPGSLEDTVLIRALVHWQRSGSGLATKKQDFSSWPCLPPSLGHRFGAGPGPARAGGRAPAARVRVRGVSPPGRGLSSVVWSTASFPLKNPPTLFWLHYSAYFSYTYRRYLDRPAAVPR